MDNIYSIYKFTRAVIDTDRIDESTKKPYRLSDSDSDSDMVQSRLYLEYFAPDESGGSIVKNIKDYRYRRRHNISIHMQIR